MAATNPKPDKDKKDLHKRINRFENSDADFTAVGRWMLIIIVLVIIIAWASYQYFQLSWQRAEESGGRRAPLAMPDQPIQSIKGPVLQLSPAETMREFAKQQEADLTGYSWLSKEAGVVRLPIEVAIAKASQEGVMVSRENEETTSTVPDDGVSLPQDSSGGRTYWNVAR